MKRKPNTMQLFERRCKADPPLRYVEGKDPRSWTLGEAFRQQAERGYHCGHVAVYYRRPGVGGPIHSAG